MDIKSALGGPQKHLSLEKGLSVISLINKALEVQHHVVERVGT